MDSYKKEIDKLNEHNRNVLHSITGRMFEMLAHEAFHSFFNNRIRSADQPPAAVRWLEEGMAMYFEAAGFDGVTLSAGAPHKEWIDFLQAKQKEGKLLPLKRLLTGTGKDFIVHHKKQTDHFYVIKGMVKIALHDQRQDSPTYGSINELYLGQHCPGMVRIPPGVQHGWMCVSQSEAYIVNIVSEMYDYSNPDEYRTDPHNNDIGYDWKRRDG